jgi:hypothetical protein
MRGGDSKRTGNLRSQATLFKRTERDLLAPQLPAISPSKPRFSQSAGAFHWRSARRMGRPAL